MIIDLAPGVEEKIAGEIVESLRKRNFPADPSGEGAAAA